MMIIFSDFFSEEFKKSEKMNIISDFWSSLNTLGLHGF
jgi:hypothetical protein